MKKSIFVVSHKNVAMPQDDMYIPIQVGQKNEDFPGYIRDNTGENIASKNPNYCELTAQYWAWKNSKADIKGLVHYRRLFGKQSSGIFTPIATRYKYVLNSETLEELLSEYDMVVPKAHNYYIETAYGHYRHAHHTEGLKITRDILKSDYPSYLKKYDEVLNRRRSHLLNMMITRKEIFDSYSEWLFDVLGKVEGRLDISNYSVSEARVFGYISELLLDVWIECNSINYVELPVLYMEKQNYFKRYATSFARKLGLLKVR
ncbi:DUF4422 domain-containing protein [uncultured Ligilactobacillus sp.]|uniref:DUF4422 domain-containing protein n=1 Tax=uncultured Ligilactobacillus sp. TaxID=2837633 RepID=UPI00272CE14A|nr:DUF4422 domain-containing protein [uncultured Ligilactobacillus sp.]